MWLALLLQGLLSGVAAQCASGTFGDGVDCNPWSTCPVGEGLQDEGTPTTDRTCTPCVLGTSFSAVDSGEACQAVDAPCAAGEYTSKAATLNSNRECTTCAGGTFKASVSGDTLTLDSNLCEAWRHCPIGEGQQTAGSSTTDRMCAPCKAGTSYSSAVTYFSALTS